MQKIDNIEDAKELLQDIENLFMNLDDVKLELERKIGQKEAEQDDYLHELELAKLNGIEIMKVANLITKTRKERRILKRKLKLVNSLKGYTDLFINKGIIGHTRQAIKNIENLEIYFETAEYEPKVVKDLKCVKKKKEEE